MKNSSDKKYLLCVNGFMQIVFCFFTLFFNIFVYDVAQDFNITLLCSLTYVVSVWLIMTIERKFLSKKVLAVLYKISFFLCLCCTLLSFLVNSERIYLVFIIQFFYAMTCNFYYTPSEIAIMNKNKKGQMKKFNGLNSFVAVFSAVLSPILSGYIIDFVSYYVLFGIMAACVVVSFLFSLKVKISEEEIPHTKLKELFALIRKDKAVRYGYVGYALKRFANDGPLESVIPILLFLRTGVNYGVGLYSALAALLAGVILIVYIYFNKNSTLWLWINSSFQFVASILLVISGEVWIFFIYYFVKVITYKMITNDMLSSVLLLTNHTPLRKYSVEHYYVINCFSTTALVSCCLICLLVYNCMRDTLSLSILIALAAAVQLVSTLFMTKSDNALKNLDDYEEQTKEMEQTCK